MIPVADDIASELLFAGVVSRIRPHRRLIELPASAGPDTPWVTIVQDRGDLAGPEAYDTETLRWWVSRGEVLAIDAAQANQWKSRVLGAIALSGDRLLVVETAEERREAWHRVLRQYGNADGKTMVLEIRDTQVLGLLYQCGELLGAEFPAELPPLPPGAGQPEIRPTT